MSLPTTYYARVVGTWDWTLTVRVRSWSALLRRRIGAVQVAAVLVWQWVAGPLVFWTRVGEVGFDGLEHETRIFIGRIELIELSKGTLKPSVGVGATRT